MELAHEIVGRPGDLVGNLETFWCWDVSLSLGAVTRTGVFRRKKQQVGNNIFVGTQMSTS
jgi:hypothetical protein